MRRESPWLFVIAVVGDGAGCGGTAARPHRRRGSQEGLNAICQATDPPKLADDGKDLLKGHQKRPQTAGKFYLGARRPKTRTKLSGLAKLHPRRRTRDKVKKMLPPAPRPPTSVETGLKEQGAAFLRPQVRQFKDFNSKAKDLKLTNAPEHAEMSERGSRFGSTRHLQVPHGAGDPAERGIDAGLRPPLDQTRTGAAFEGCPPGSDTDEPTLDQAEGEAVYNELGRAATTGRRCSTAWSPTRLIGGRS